MKNCPYCTSENPDNATICAYCGQSLSVAQPAPPPTGAAPQPVYPQSPVPVQPFGQPVQYGDSTQASSQAGDVQDKRNKWVVWTVILVVAAAIVCAIPVLCIAALGFLSNSLTNVFDNIASYL